MRVALDIQTAIGGRNTGVGQYTEAIRRVLPTAPKTGVVEIRRRGDAPIGGAIERVWWEWVQMPAYATESKADILFSPGFSAQRVPVMPLAITVHDLLAWEHPEELGRWNRWYWRHVVPWSWKKADLCICVSQETERRLNRVFPEIKKSVVVSHGVDPLFSREGEREEEDYLLMVGGWPRRKNLLAAVHAISTVPESPPLWVVGAVPPALRESIEKFLGERIKFLGYVERERMPSLYRGAHLVLAPSLGEGFGFVPLEGAACGSAVLMSDIPTHREALPGVEPYGIPHSSESLPRALRSALRDTTPFLAPPDWVPRRWEDAGHETAIALESIL